MAISADRPTVTSGVSSGVSIETAGVVESLLKSVVLVRTHGGSGSGVIWDSDGLIVTNSHVVRGESARVDLWDGRRLNAALVARDPEHDLASLRMDVHGLPAVRVGDSSRLRVGELALAVGNPFGMRGVVTAGIITGVGQVSKDGHTRMEDLIQADVSLAPGNSGGPLVDVEGRVLGINSMISAEGIALAIPSQVVLDFLSPARNSRTYVGIAGMPVQVRVDGAPRGGLLLTSVEEGSPADRAGLIQGDVLLTFGGQDVERLEDFRGRLVEWPSGEAVRMVVIRGGELREFAVVPAARIAA